MPNLRSTALGFRIEWHKEAEAGWPKQQAPARDAIAITTTAKQAVPVIKKARAECAPFSRR
jgi:hypothetical protein